MEGRKSDNALDLVRLQMTDEVPVDREVRSLLDFLQRLLHLVFAEIAMAGHVRGTDGVRREGFGDGDETDRGGIPARGTRRTVEAGAHRGQVGSDGVGIRVGHYCFGFSASMACLTSAACDPFGSAARYPSNAVTALAESPRFM